MAAASSQPAGDYQPLRAARHETLTIDGARMGVTRWGPASSSPIVLLHGWMDLADSWQLLVDQLPADWSFAALDWRGFGASEPRQGGYWGPQYLADLEAALLQLVPQGTVRLIGHSLGGTVASLYAGVRFERMRWLVNLEGFGLPQHEPAALPARLTQWLDQLQHVPVARHYDSLDYLAARVLHTNPKLGPVHARFLAQVWSEAKDGGLALRADPAHWVRGPLRYARAELEACWARIAAPTLLVAGGDSLYMQHLGPSAALDDWPELYPRATLREVQGAGHLLHHEQPAVVAGFIREFVEGVEAS
jgi:pimeloyl-ACP methyl ester carboxylesterase